MQKPIPNGTYDIVDNDANTNPKHDGWFRLDSQDSEPYNDTDDSTGRNGFRLHPGAESWGCVTVDKTKGDRTDEWSALKSAIEGTTTSSVPEKRGNQKWNAFSWLIKYGTLKVIGEDKVPEKKEEKK